MKIEDKTLMIEQLEKDVKRETYIRTNKIDREEGEKVTDEEYLAMIQALAELKPDSEALPLTDEEYLAMQNLGTIFRE